MEHIMELKDVEKLESILFDTRYSTASISREDTIKLMREIQVSWNMIAELKGEELPFPPTSDEKPEREAVGFNGPV